MRTSHVVVIDTVESLPLVSRRAAVAIGWLVPTPTYIQNFPQNPRYR